MPITVPQCVDTSIACIIFVLLYSWTSKEAKGILYEGKSLYGLVRQILSKDGCVGSCITSVVYNAPG